MAILRKDFLLTQEDISASYYAGADAVLLIAAILSATQIVELVEKAEQLGMRALVEVHTVEEIEKTRMARPHLVGVNCRNLETFLIDTLRPLLLIKQIDWECDLVFESGVSAPEQIRMARMSGYKAILIGKAVMRNSSAIPQLIASLSDTAKLDSDSEQDADMSAKQIDSGRVHFWNAIAEKLSNRQQHPLVKICGITNLEDAEEAVRCGADILGFVLCESPRKVSIETVRKFSKIKVLKVAIIDGDEPIPDGIHELYLDGCIDALQVHGGEIRSRDAEFHGCPYYQALRLRTEGTYADMEQSPSPRILIDSYQEGEKGGYWCTHFR